MKSILRSLLPTIFLRYFRQYNKKIRSKTLERQKKSGSAMLGENLYNAFRDAGIKNGDVLLVHSSLSKIGYVEGGAKTVVQALMDSIGQTGHLLMPTSPNTSYQLDYIRKLDVFDVANTPSKLGSISEYFRKLPSAVRSAHPTEPVSCIGPNASEFIEGHFNCLTPYSSESPFFKVQEKKGKILYLGVTLANAGTSLHLLEDAVNQFKFPVYFQEIFEVNLRLEDGTYNTMKTLVHNPVQSKNRRCDDLIPLFESKGVLKKVKIGQADSLLVDAKGMFDVMLEEYNKRGVTMYTPFGS